MHPETERDEEKAKIIALSQAAELSLEDAETALDDGDWVVYTDDQADDAVTEYVKDSVWAFNASFLSAFTGLPEEVFTALQDKCEGANDAFLAIIERTPGKDLGDFVQEATSADGRGHFLSSYDGDEYEETVDGVTYYCYRVN